MRGLGKVSAENVRFDYGRLAQMVQDSRKDGMLIDFGRNICAHFQEMVKYWSAQEGRPVSGHNNKTLFLEAVDIWCRKRFCNSGGSTWTSNPKDVIEFTMKPYYEAMALDDPSRFKMGRPGKPPSYVGTHEDAIAIALGLCACLEVQPLQFRLGINNGTPEHIWGRAHADGKWYDMDFSRPEFKLGDYLEFQDYEEVEIPL